MTLTASQNYEHVCDARAGADRLHDLQYGAAIAAGETWERGALLSLNDDGELQAGLSSLHAMPIWAINATDDYDVASESGGLTGEEPAGWVGTGGFELYTSEYDADGTYTPNVLLTGGTGDNLGDTVVKTNQYIDGIQEIVGVVSEGVVNNEYDVDVLYFWPTFIPTIAP